MMENKPMSMSLTDFFTRKVAMKTMTSEHIVDAIIKHQWKLANESTKSNTEVEVSGIGKFYTSKRKVLNRLEKLEKTKSSYNKFIDKTTDPYLVDITRNKLSALEDKIKQLKSKIEDDQY